MTCQPDQSEEILAWAIGIAVVFVFALVFSFFAQRRKDRELR